jgi:hypothetical protein
MRLLTPLLYEFEMIRPAPASLLPPTDLACHALRMVIAMFSSSNRTAATTTSLRKIHDAVNATPRSRALMAVTDAEARAKRRTCGAPASVPRLSVSASVPQVSGLPSVPTDAEIEHWDILFSAVTQRIGRAVAEWSSAENSGEGGVDILRATLLECVAALERLHAIKVYEVSRKR